MPCTVAVSNSTVFSPSSSLFCKTSFPHPLSRLNNSPSSSSSLGLETNGLSVSCADEDGPSTSNPSPPALLKRKRPARLDIPIGSSGFGALVETPRVDGAEVELEKDGLYSVCCKRGRRATMEDRYSAVLNIQGDSKQAFFGVFDGHGGAKAAEFAAENLEKNIMDEVIKTKEDDIQEAVKRGYLKTDLDFMEKDLHGGSCCVTALIRNGNLVVSNAGDCRAVLSRGGVAEALTTDHRPSREDEKYRIQAMGGYVDCFNGVWRIQGSLAVSRGIGDRHFKQWVIAEPDTQVHRITADYEFLILASDGLWDKVTNQEAVDVAHPLCVGISKPEPVAACKKLMDLSISRGSADDISVMLIQFEGYIANSAK
ncbi:hypothetical protein Nepgr_009205 [Nepenthes gracilis]|uniref:protein-serine/threonine phosphatase n=1 Tax=Nepenthes gracilis TaxID=150966 RepID=A0AAD3XK51_NEPGR|nr:hypothetical protein Nepgr_009205 [Nepenthes gracilis]